MSINLVTNNVARMKDLLVNFLFKRFNEIKDYIKNIEIEDANVKNGDTKIDYWIEDVSSLNKEAADKRPTSSSRNTSK